MIQWLEASFRCMERENRDSETAKQHDEENAYEFWIPGRVGSARTRASGRAEPPAHQQYSTSARGNRSSEVDHSTPAGDSSAPRLRGERSTAGRIPGDLRGSRAKLRLPW